MDPREFINVNMGRLTHEQASNIAREIRELWKYLGDVRPQGDRHAVAQLKVTKDSFDQYHFYLNHQAIKYLLMYAKNIPGPIAERKELSQKECPPQVPDFLRWGERSGSTSE